jgi:hypothetical protein
MGFLSVGFLLKTQMGRKNGGSDAFDDNHAHDGGAFRAAAGLAVGSLS